MEIIASSPISILNPNRSILTPNQSWQSSLRLNPIRRTNLGLHCYTNSSLNSRTSEETSTGSVYAKEETGGVVLVEDVKSVESNEIDMTEGISKESVVDETEGSAEESSGGEVEGAEKEYSGNEIQPLEFLDKLNIKFDSENPIPVLVLGGGSLVALWLTTAVVGAIDSIPVFPKLMELVGLAYSLWFTTRYILFKENRDELTAKIEEIKNQVIGSDDN